MVHSNPNEEGVLFICLVGFALVYKYTLSIQMSMVNGGSRRGVGSGAFGGDKTRVNDVFCVSKIRYGLLRDAILASNVQNFRPERQLE